MGNFGPSGGILWLYDIDDAIWFICKENIKSVALWFLTALVFQRQLFDWNNLKLRIVAFNAVAHTSSLLQITRFISSAVDNIH